ncbi:hypothetical protein DB32_006900 [Sandaracinus amylolyticus]|uniref:Uncharacterized protein n=1 Tax=Sandaracinus amylolyticus TaxID=927083 RepID=A0A0F6YKZ5_9BACT|nr:hypothetical protein DB32_006900 [Sandaracinus amylolyticus]
MPLLVVAQRVVGHRDLARPWIEDREGRDPLIGVQWKATARDEREQNVKQASRTHRRC